MNPEHHGFYQQLAGLVGLVGWGLAKLLYEIDGNIGHINQYLQSFVLIASLTTICWGWLQARKGKHKRHD